jgi:hypothetical protein
MSTKKSLLLSYGFSLLLAFSFLSSTAFSQENTTSAQTPNESTIEGTVASVSRQTFVVRTEDNQFYLFTFNRYTDKPQSIPVGTRVRVESRPGAETGTRLATRVRTLEAAASPQQRAAGTEAAPIPESVRDVESDIRREARRWKVGVRAGVAFDPELFMFGVHSQMGPIFTPRVFFRPSAEFAFGEVTDLIALNLEGVYRFRSAERRSWSPYVGAGPVLTFIHQNFQAGRDIDFGNFDFDAGFNILLGMQSRRGTFFEAKTSLWSQPAPVLRLIVGYNF